MDCCKLVILFLSFVVSANGRIILTNLYSFDGTNAALPESALIQTANGDFYGTTLAGGSNRLGTVFRLTPDGALTFLVSFNGTNGAWPVGSKLATGRDGGFYGTTYKGGANDLGTVFRMTANGVLTSLISFTGTNEPYLGANPRGELAQGLDGNFYGTTTLGGVSNLGTVFRLTPNGDFTNLISFNGTNGEGPEAGLLLAADGNFYGTTALGGTNGNGTIFRMTPEGVLTTLFSFNGTNGTSPYGKLALDKVGNFYGTTYSDGISNMGTVFMLTTNGEFTHLLSFNGMNGRFPVGELILAGDGNFYGTTDDGGTNDGGTVFRLTPAGNLTSLVSFANGLGPGTGLTLSANGEFYGTTQGDGNFLRGSIFRLSIPLPPVFQSVAISNGTVNLKWNSVAEQIYQLQTISELDSTNWTAIGNPIPAMSGSVTVSAPMNSPRQFYRAVILP
jgi:uncharacterized repeat protein (TIGR03803 family)